MDKKCIFNLRIPTGSDGNFTGESIRTEGLHESELTLEIMVVAKLTNL